MRGAEEAVTLANRNGKGAGDHGTPPRRKPMQMPRLQDVAEDLADALETRVTVAMGKRKGKIVVEFATVDDLERIVAAIKK